MGNKKLIVAEDNSKVNTINADKNFMRSVFKKVPVDLIQLIALRNNQDATVQILFDRL